MPREARIVIVGMSHHITQRGIRREPVFRDDEDRFLYSELMLENSFEFGMHIEAYSWMPNHIHVVAVPDRADSFEKIFRRLNSRYARLFNKKYGLSGYLWESRPWSCPIADTHYWNAIRYVERNPVRARLVERAEDYPWSSAPAHCGLAEDRLLDSRLSPVGFIQNWSHWLGEPDDPVFNKLIRENTFGQGACGGSDFKQCIERVTGRHLEPKKPGPKRKT